MAAKRKTGLFKGDTLAKKLARLETWQTAHDLLGEKRFRGPHLFLSGPLCADASVAVGLGVSPGELVAVDHDANIVEAAQWRWPKLDIRHEDAITAVADRVLNKIGFNFVFLDFCAQMLDDSIDTVGLALVEGLNEYGVVAAAFQASREMPKDGVYHGEILKARDVIAKQLAQMPQEERDNWEPLLPALARFPIFRRALIERTSCHGMVPVPVSVIFYKSKTEGDHHGMGMCCFIVQGVPCEPREANDPHLIEAWTRRPKFHYIDPTPSDFGLRVDALARHGHDPALLLDLTKGTVGAYKANATRGTYQDGRAYARELRASVFSGYWPGTYEAGEPEKEEAPCAATKHVVPVATPVEAPRATPVEAPRAAMPVEAPTSRVIAINPDRIFLTTEDEPCDKPSPGYDLAGTERHDVVVVRVVGNHPQRGRKWLCLCIACGSNFCRYTGEIIRSLKSTVYSFSCTVCSRELRAGRSLEKAQPNSEFRSMLRNRWDEYGSLYTYAWEEWMKDVLREEFFQDEPWPLEQLSLPIYTEPLGETRRRKPESEDTEGAREERSRKAAEARLARRVRERSDLDRALETARKAEAEAKLKAEIAAQVDPVFMQAQVEAARQAGQNDAATYVARLRGVDLKELEERLKAEQLDALKQQFPIGAVVDVTLHDGRVYRSVVQGIFYDGTKIMIDNLGRPYPPEQLRLVDASELSTYDGTLKLVRAQPSNSRSA